MNAQISCVRQLLNDRGYIRCKTHRWRGPIHQWWHGACPESKDIEARFKQLRTLIDQMHDNRNLM